MSKQRYQDHPKKIVMAMLWIKSKKCRMINNYMNNIYIIPPCK